jgi:hypothetical protein
MKKQITFLVSGVVSLIFFSTSVAQGDGFKELPPITITASSNTVSVSAKIDRAFSQYFKNATHLRWFELDKNFLVKFIMNDQENRALFTSGGQLIYHISYGSEKHLPADVRKLIKSTYYDQVITRILKITQDHRLIWVIHMEDNKEYIMARVEDNELEETKRMLKD